MKKYIQEKVKTFIVLTCFFLSFSYSYANMIWPSIYIASGLTKYYIVFFTFIFTYLFLRIIIKDKPKLTILALSVGFTFLTSLVGTFVVPILGLIAELVFSFLNVGTFSLISWIIEILFSVAFYALLFSSIVKLVYKISVKRTYLPFFIYSLITIGLATVEVLIIHPQGVVY